MTKCGFVQCTRVEDLDPIYKKIVKKIEKNLKSVCVLLDEESITGVYEEKDMADDILQILQSLQVEEIESNAMDVMIEVHTQALYDEIFKAMEVFGKCGSYGLRPEATVYTKYKTVAKKIVVEYKTQASPYGIKNDLKHHKSDSCIDPKRFCEVEQ